MILDLGAVTIPLRLPSAANLREHFMVKARRVKREREAVAWVLGNRERPTLPVVVTLTRIGPRAFDGDNNVASLKSTQDEVARWLRVDDRDPRVTWRYAQRKDAPKVYAVEVVFSGVGCG